MLPENFLLCLLCYQDCFTAPSFRRFALSNYKPLLPTVLAYFRIPSVRTTREVLATKLAGNPGSTRRSLYRWESMYSG